MKKKLMGMFVVLFLAAGLFLTADNTVSAKESDYSSEIKDNKDGTLTLTLTDKTLKESYDTKGAQIPENEMNLAAYQWMVSMTFGKKWKVEANLNSNSAESLKYRAQKVTDMNTPVLYMKYDSKKKDFDFESESKPIDFSVDGTTMTWKVSLPKGCSFADMTEAFLYTVDRTRTPSHESKMIYSADTKDVSNSSVTGITDKVYTGKAQTQKLKVSLGGKTLKSGKNYTVAYQNNKEIGKAEITITGKGAYKGKFKTSFYIIPARTELLSARLQEDGSVLLKWKKNKKVTSYEIYYSSAKEGKYSKIGEAKKNTVTSYAAQDIENSGEVYFKIRGYKKVGKTKYYSEYSQVVLAK